MISRAGTLLLIVLAFGGTWTTLRPPALRAQVPVDDEQRALSGKKPRRVTMAELHRSAGVPSGWTFALPRGDATRGRQVFVDLECFRCHVVRGERFPEPASPGGRQAGPDLTGMGAHHPAEYFAESILDPNAVIVQGPGFTGRDGLSSMPSFAESMSVTQLIDLVAYLTSLGSAASGRQFLARGIVRAVLREAGQLVIAHDDIPGYMPAMTMSFPVDSPALFDGVEAGDAVAFVVRVRSAETTPNAVITQMRRSTIEQK